MIRESIYIYSTICRNPKKLERVYDMVGLFDKTLQKEMKGGVVDYCIYENDIMEFYGYFFF